MSRELILALIVALALAAVFAVWQWRADKDMPVETPPAAGTLPEPCRDLVFEGVSYIVCAAPVDAYEIVLKLKGRDGKPYGKPDRLAAELPFAFAMNAGMYHEDFSPVGLHVEDGREIAPLNLGDAPGNFFMKPNGVFFVDGAGKAGLLASEAFAAAKPAVKYATQSGPMLVIEGEVHPRFEPDGQSKYIRNGVGVDKSGVPVFAISRTPVSLGSFARLFRNALDCPDALFFDGAVSALHDGSNYLIGGSHPAGPIVAVVKR
jgi:uncharacterized protein YigE (DUF2233 family)